MAIGRGCLVEVKLKGFLGLKIPCLDPVCMGWIEVDVGKVEERVMSIEFSLIIGYEEAPIEVNS